VSKIAKDKLIFVGDIHGKFRTMDHECHDRYKHRNAHIIQVGDFGVGFYKDNYYKEHLGAFNTSLEEFNNHLWVIRGNHDNPEWFKKTNNPFDLEHITLLQDYSELNLCGKSIFLAGGAYSVDRFHRKQNVSYWDDEHFVLDREYQFQKEYDIVVTHTRPLCSGAFLGFKNVQHYINQDADLQEDLIDEGLALDELYKATKPKHWFFGHFHESLTTQYENTLFKALNINEHLDPFPY
jgi:predicted phosphodiesterase